MAEFVTRPISYEDGDPEASRRVQILSDKDNLNTSSFSTTSKMPSHSIPNTPGGKPPADKERKIGHRRVDDAGQVTYKRKPTSELMAAIQLGIGQSIGRLTPKAKRDVLYEDFHIVETVIYPREGSNLTPAHHYSDFRFKTYAPIAFRYFRDLFGIQPDDFLLSLCNEPLRELSNPGASGSIFYITNDDEFIIKTVQHKEAEFLQKLLPGYYMNLNQNVRTLLPKFYGLYCYQCGGKNIRFVVMNNLLPTSVHMHSKFDLKGSTYKRRASKHEATKGSPTYKDLDFVEQNPEGLFLGADAFSALMKTMERDCRVLQSFKIMDYSLLLTIHNLDAASNQKFVEGGASQTFLSDSNEESNLGDITRQRSGRYRLAQYSTAMESIHAPPSDPVGLESSEITLTGGIRAWTSRGERIVLYLGIIDILQSYRFSKKLEHTFKAIVADGDTVSVHRPGYYAQRFLNFFNSSVFKKIISPLKHSPSKRKSVTERQKSVVEADVSFTEKKLSKEISEEGAVGGRPDVLPSDRGTVVSVEVTTEGLVDQDKYQDQSTLEPNVRYRWTPQWNVPESATIAYKTISESSEEPVARVSGGYRTSVEVARGDSARGRSSAEVQKLQRSEAVDTEDVNVKVIDLEDAAVLSPASLTSMSGYNASAEQSTSEASCA